MRPPEDVGPEGLRGLDGDQGAPVEGRGDVAHPVDLGDRLDGVRHREARAPRRRHRRWVTASTTASKTEAEASGRAASCTRTTAASSGTAARPRRTDSARVEPPGHHDIGTVRFRSRWEGRQPGPPGRRRTDTGRHASTAHSSTGRPPRSENCLGRPNRRPDPAATTMDHTSATVPPGRAIRSGRRSDALRPSPRPR